MKAEAEITARCRFHNIDMASISLVFINTEETHHVELRQLGDEYKKQCGKVDCKVVKLILCVETCQKKQDNRNNGDEFTGSGKLLPIVNLFPSSHKTGLPLVQQLPRGALYLMQEQVVCQVVYDIGKSPCRGYRQNGYGKEEEMQS